jgi:predicted DNA-binding antitoxin AbrB/MazE fold protein
MESQSIDAVFENGTFRPVNPSCVLVREGEQVRLRIEQSSSRTSIELACAVYDGLSPAEVDEIERIAFDRSRFFDARNAG